MIQHFMLQEAIHSTAMEHPKGCDCTTCRAAAGDDAALGSIYREYSFTVTVPGETQQTVYVTDMAGLKENETYVFHALEGHGGATDGLPIDEAREKGYRPCRARCCQSRFDTKSVPSGDTDE